MPVSNTMRAVVKIRQEATPESRPTVVPPRDAPGARLNGAALLLLSLAGVVIGFGVFQAIQSGVKQPSALQPTLVATYEVRRAHFESSLRVGGTVGAVDFAMIRAPRMRGGRDRGGGGSLTIESLAIPGSIVERGDVVAVFESRRTADVLDDYESRLAQTRRRTMSRKAELLISTEDASPAAARSSSGCGQGQTRFAHR